MSAFAAWLGRRRWLVVGVWLALVAISAPLALRQSEHLTGGGFSAAESQSSAVSAALEQDFAASARPELAAVLVRSPGAGPAGVDKALEALKAATRAVDGVALKRRTQDRARRERRAPTQIVALRLSVSGNAAQDATAALYRQLDVGGGRSYDGVRVSLIGQQALTAALQDRAKRDLAAAERTGFPLVLLILVVIFGSLAAATLPIAVGAVSVVITGAAIYLLSQAMEMSLYASNVASMIGIAVAVDYSLFILARYRQEIAACRTRDAALRAALATSGVAVAFSGLTVIVAVAGLWTVESTALRSMAVGAIVVVAISVLAAMTLLPVLIGLLGRRAAGTGPAIGLLGGVVRLRPGGAPRRGGRNFWARWVERVTRRPLRHAILAGGVLLLMASPVLAMRTDEGLLRQLPAGDPTRAGFEHAARSAGPGAASRTEVLMRFGAGTLDRAENRHAVQALRRLLAADPEVQRVAPTRRARDRRAVLLAVEPAHDGESSAAKTMVHRLREQLPRSAAGQNAEILVGGPTSAAEIDAQHLISGSMWRLILFVLAFSYVVLVCLLRSLLLPLKAVLTNLLSIGAAYGVLVVVFQWGWIDGFLGFESQGHVQMLTPPIVLAVVFGISMDYEVFLLSRIRERRARGASNSQAVAEGLAGCGRTITSAAVVMVAVFAVFVGTGVPAVKELGLGCAVAVALDATLVRLVLVPASMELMGEWNWWLPRSLRRLLPQVWVERPLAHAATGGEGR